MIQSHWPELVVILHSGWSQSLDDAQRVTEKGNILLVFVTMGDTNRGGTLIVIRLCLMCCEMIRFLFLFVPFLHKIRILALF